MHKQHILTIFIIMLMLIFGGCSDLMDNTFKSNKTVAESSSYEKDITDLIKKNLQDNKVESLEIKEIANEDNSIFVQFLVYDGILREGLAYIEKMGNLYNLVEIDIAKTDLNTPFTRHILSMPLEDGRDCRLIGGCINDKDIKEIHFEYKNNTLKVIKIGAAQNTFLEYIIGDLDSLVEITGYDKKMNVLYSYE